MQVSGLDIGWGTRMDLEWDPKTHRYMLRRELPPGRYPYKFIFDNRWTYSADHPTMQVLFLSPRYHNCLSEGRLFPGMMLANGCQVMACIFSLWNSISYLGIGSGFL